MPYVFNEGSLELPSPPEDRSVNVLIVPNPEEHGEPLTLVITRDEMEPGETLEECVKRQLVIISRQLRGFAELKREETLIGTEQIPGILIEAHNSNAGSKIYQWLAIFPVSDRKIFVYALSSVRPFRDAQRQMWKDILASYTPAQQA